MADWPEGLAPVPDEISDAMRTAASLELTNTRLEFSDVAPVMDELARRTGSASVHRNNPANPLMGGGVVDVAIALVILMAGAGAIEYGRTMGRLLAEDSHALLRGLWALRKKEIASRSEGLDDSRAKELNQGTAISIEANSVRFYFVGDLSDDEVARRAQKAADLVSGGLTTKDAPLGLIFDSETDQWKAETGP
jgi:hypothetical protein